MERFYKIAGLTVKMDSFGRTAQQARSYEAEPTALADFTVASHWKEMKSFYPGISDDEGEYMYSGAEFYQALLNYDGFCLHSSAVVVDGKAYLFSADSGTGKSTHTALWLKLFDGAYLLNDDKPALRLENGVWYAYGTPWSGKYDISVNKRIPLAGIAILERSTENSIEPFRGVEAVRRVLAQANKIRTREYREKQLDLLGKLFDMVPVWRLRCNMDPAAARLSYEAMSAGQKEK